MPQPPAHARQPLSRVASRFLLGISCCAPRSEKMPRRRAIAGPSAAGVSLCTAMMPLILFDKVALRLRYVPFYIYYFIDASYALQIALRLQSTLPYITITPFYKCRRNTKLILIIRLLLLCFLLFQLPVPLLLLLFANTSPSVCLRRFARLRPQMPTIPDIILYFTMILLYFSQK